jgi:hypothetical protein
MHTPCPPKHDFQGVPCPPKHDFQEWENVKWENGLKLVARVKQHPLVHHAVHTHYDSVVDETSTKLVNNTCFHFAKWF